MPALSTATLHAQADQAAAAGDFLAALAASAEVLQAIPQDHRARLKLGLCLAMLDRRTEAVKTLQVVAESLAHQGFMLAAIGACRDALGLVPDEPTIMETLRALHRQIRGHERKGKATVPPPIPPVTIESPNTDGLFAKPPEDVLPLATDLGTTLPPIGDAADSEYVPLFSELSEEAFASLVPRIGYLKVAAGHPIVREGHTGTSVYILLEGEVQVSKEAGDESQLLARLGAGSIFGELAMLTEKPRQATVMTSVPSELFEIDKESLAAVAAEHPQVTEDIVQFARRRLLMNVMATSRLFAPFDHAQRLEILKKFEPRIVDQGHSIIEDGQQAEGLFVVVEGEVEVSKVDEGGERVILAYLKAGDVFGEIAIIEEQPATADVRAVEKSVLLCLGRDKFKAFAEAHPAIIGVLRDLSGARRQALEQAMAEAVVHDADDLIIL